MLELGSSGAVRGVSSNGHSYCNPRATADIPACAAEGLQWVRRPDTCHLRRRHVPVSNLSTCRLPQPEQTSRSRRSSTAVSAPYRAAISAAKVFQGSVISNWQTGDILIGRLQRKVR